jgi:predicted RND superfamily exporter protein
MIGLFVWIYRSLRLLTYTVGIVALATYLTLGVYGSMGYRLNLMTVLLPVIIVLLGILDAVHVLNEAPSLQAEGMTGKAAALEALRKVWRPCLFTTLTTGAGFLSLATSPMAILRNFGLFAALGIGLCLYFTYLLGVLLLPGHRPAGQVTQRTAAGLTRLLGFVLAQKRLLGGIALLLIIVFATGIARLRSDTYTLGYLPDSHPVVRDHRSIEKTWGLYMPLELLVTPRPGYSLHSPKVVQAGRAFADSVRSLPGVGRVFGFYALYEAGLQAQYKGKSPKLLRSKSALLGVHKRLGRDYPQLAGKFIHTPTGTGRITVSGAMLSAGALRGKLDTLRGIAAVTLGKVARVTPAGYQPLYAGIVRYVTRSQVDSLLMSFGLVFVLVWLFLRDAKLAALTVVPNLFPVLVMLGAMGWLGIYLDTATASIAAIVLSICTDDSIHFIHAYRHHRQLGLSPDGARQATVAHVGPAVVLAGGVLFCGYAFMMLGSLKTVQLWGLLTAIAIAAAMFGELVLFPLVLERFDREPAKREVSGGS